MTRILPLALVTALVAACTPPDPASPPTTAVAAGVTVGSNGVQPSAAILRTNGNVSIGIGLGN